MQLNRKIPCIFGITCLNKAAIYNNSITLLVIEKFDLSEKCALSDDFSIIERIIPALYNIQHICTDCRIVDITRSVATTKYTEDRQSECISAGRRKK